MSDRFIRLVRHAEVTGGRRFRGSSHEPLAHRPGISLNLDSDRAERGFGSCHGRDAAGIAASDRARFYTDPAGTTAPGAEALDGFAERLPGAWARLLAGKAGGILAATHGGLIRVIVASVLQMPMSAVGLIQMPDACLIRIRVPLGRPSPMSRGGIS